MNAMIHTVIHTAHTHSLMVDPGRNRIYFTVFAYPISWNNTFLDAWQEALHLVSRGFTVVMDISHLQQVSKEWIEISAALQQMLIEAGLAAAAEVLSEHLAEILGIRQTNRISLFRYIKEETFTNRRLAEAWLDTIHCHS